MFKKIYRKVLGNPLHDSQEHGEKLPKWKALAIFSSDALSSVGYGPEQIVLILALPGIIAYGYLPYVLLAILTLLGIVTLSYTQVTKANPGGGGSYAVAKNHLGELIALIAAAAIFSDYALTVAVSVSSGTDALTSAFPFLSEEKVLIDIFVIFAILTIVNLRGLRESSNVFVWPTYLFVFGLIVIILTGIFNAITDANPIVSPQSTVKSQFDMAMLILLLRAFANGCSSMTGLEAISNGVPMFKKPQAENAVKTTYWMSGLLSFMLIGIGFLLMHYHIMPVENVTMLSQLVEMSVGRGFWYYYVQITTMLILYLAANTSYNGLPPLMSILAKDGYMPRYLGAKGERLSFSNGIMLLSFIAGLLIIVFDGNVEHLISLYAIGVFLSFTIAQTGMVVHWYKEKEPGWQKRLAINAFGAIITTIVVGIIIVTKFMHGAWIVIVFLPTMVYIFKKIKEHYNQLAAQLALPNPIIPDKREKKKNFVIVAVASPNQAVVKTMQYARTISDEITAINVFNDPVKGREIEDKWKQLEPDIKLVTIYSPYRMIIDPILEYVQELEDKKDPNDYITIIIPEFETNKWWHRLLHSQTAIVLRERLILNKDVIVTTIPYHIEE